MAGNRAGGLKAAQTSKERHGDDFYVKIGKKSKGYARPGSGFGAMSPEKRKLAGQKGGINKGINHRAKMDKN